MNQILTSSTATLRMIVSLDKIAQNYDLVRGHTKAIVAAVVKSNAYGMGKVPITNHLFDVGCRDFYVATFNEGQDLRKTLPQDARIYVLNTYLGNSVDLYDELNLIPVINTLDNLKLWFKTPRKQPYLLHFDTGMNRLGLGLDLVDKVASLADAHKNSHSLSYILSHMACADDPENAKNLTQLNNFKKVIKNFPDTKYSLAASESLELGPDYYFDMIRMGMSLYGTIPSLKDNFTKEFQFAFKTQAQILQIRTLEPGETIGYGATYRALEPRRIATISVGFADGLSRSLSNKGLVFIQDYTAPIVGRVSMDLTTIDVTDIPKELTFEGSWVDLIQDPVSLYKQISDSGTALYEMLSRLGPRYERMYVK